MLDRMRSLYRRLHRHGRTDRQIDAELRYHLEEHVEANIAAGMPPEEARRHALLTFGGVERFKEECRDERPLRLLEDLFQDIRYGLRQLRRSPGFTIVAILTLALGIGANVGMFTVMNFMLLRELPFPEPDRLVTIYEKRPRENMMTNVVAPADYFDWREQSQSFESMAGFYGDMFNLLEGEPVRVDGGAVAANFFDVLGVRPRLGAGFTAEQEENGRHRVVIFSDGLWQRKFGGDPEIVGKTVNISGFLYTVVGVMPPGFELPFADFELYVPYAPRTDERSNRANHFLNVVARLKRGVSLGTARAELEAISARLEQQFPVPNRGHSANAVELQESIVREVRPALLVLAGAVGFVLLITCANLANLVLARATTRRREMAVRLALGAGRGRVVRQVLTESVLLGVLGGVAGVLLAMHTTTLLGLLLPPQGPFGRLQRAPLEWRVLGFALLVSVASGLLFGLAPAIQAFRERFRHALAETTVRFTPGRQLFRKALVVSQVALSLVLLAGAGLLLRSFDMVRRQDPGFRAEGVLTFHLALPFATYREDARKLAFVQELLGKLGQIPGVGRAGITSHLPASGADSRSGFVVDGVEPEPGVPRRAHWRIVTPGYFETLQTPLRQGRYFSESDVRGRPRVMIVNEAAARYWPDRNPVGKRARFAGGEEGWLEVVGMVANARHWGLDVEPRPEAYVCVLQTPFWSNFVAIRTSGDPEAIVAQAREAVRSLDPQLPIAAMRTMEQVVSRSLAARRFPMALLGLFAAIALLVAATGVFGVMNYLVGQRTQEIGVRMALGATQADVAREVLLPFLGLVSAGLAAGMGGGLAVASVLSNQVYGIGVRDPVTFIAVPVFLLLAALAAAAVPLRRAMRVDPAVALRCE